MIKLTVLYGHPVDPAAFEDYYANTHFAIFEKMGIKKFEITKFDCAPDGNEPAYYRAADLYFSSSDELQKAMASPEGQATAADVANFATGGATFILGTVEESQPF